MATVSGLYCLENIMPKIKVNDINIYYETYGEGTPIVCIAGFSGVHNMWQWIVDKCVSQGFQIILLDNRGVGQSDCPDYPYTIEMMADDVIGLCDALNIKSANFIGNSMGGCIVQQIMGQYPQYVISAVISNSLITVELRTLLFIKMGYEFIDTDLDNAKKRALIEANLSFCYANSFLIKPGILDTFVAYALNDPYPMSEVGYRNQLHALIQFDSSRWINTVKAPCLVLSSTEDIITPPRQVEQLAHAIPGAEYHCFTGLGHVPCIEQPKLFNQVVLNFLAKYKQ
jgi:3-oxoadipate enol-lactonase